MRACVRVCIYDDWKNLQSDFEHGYKKEHSTEKLLLKVKNDFLLIACNNQTPAVVLLLDLSAAFDTVYQIILIRILEEKKLYKGKLLDCFKSFLIGQTQRVNVLSPILYLKFSRTGK